MLCATAMLWVSTGLTRKRFCSKFSVLNYIRVRSNCLSVYSGSESSWCVMVKCGGLKNDDIFMVIHC
ncbi:unnamed protein product [Arctia plantaginis]|uniref:Uncharacterized protein n=1 Tax=Arctia plantaginis TaxID=874455 RepID=A0A8S1A2M3_ARCPL|nr:unnamed protein product [Arctia plantaginis]